MRPRLRLLARTVGCRSAGSMRAMHSRMKHSAGCKLHAATAAYAMLYMTSRGSAISSTSAAAQAGASPPHQVTVQLLMPVLVMPAVQLMAPCAEKCCGLVCLELE